VDTPQNRSINKQQQQAIVVLLSGCEFFFHERAKADCIDGKD
jgi:hypothetical protein